MITVGAVLGFLVGKLQVVLVEQFARYLCPPRRRALFTELADNRADELTNRHACEAFR